MQEDSIQRWADEAAIRDLIARIGMIRAFGTPEDYAAMFTPDAQWERPTDPGGEAKIRGLEAELEHFRDNIAAGISGPGSHAHHIIPSTVVTLDGDAATAVSQLIFVNNADAKPNIVKMWIVRDALARTPEGWRIRRRRMEKP
jgi:hypothetical protein